MSKINILGVADDIKSKTTVYTPIIEAIVNSIQAIADSQNKNDGKILITLKRSKQQALSTELGKSNFVNVKIQDNGIGFNKINLDSFDTYLGALKYESGGKGFGRFMYIKYFNNVYIQSIFVNDSGDFKKCSFEFGKGNDIVQNRKVENYKGGNETESVISLDGLRSKVGHFPKELETIARVILEKLLVYFISYKNLPQIILKEEFGKHIVLNEILKDNKEIQKIKQESFILKERKHQEKFDVKIFKIYSPNNQKSKIIFTADSREVIFTNLEEYIPEFEEEFVDKEIIEGGKEKNRNFIIKAYVLGKYLNNNVTRERNDFDFEKENDLFLPFCKKDIEVQVTEIVRKEFSNVLESRKGKKQKKVKEYLKENPYYKEYKQYIHWDSIPMNPTEDKIEEEFHKIKYTRTKEAKIKINSFLENFDEKIKTKIDKVFLAIDQAKRSDLAHYISLRKVVLDVFKKLLEIEDNKKTHKKEDLLHSIIFPTKKDSDGVFFKDHNLWILDERLSFTEYLRSDMPLSKEVKGRPDIINFDERVSYRGKNDPSNPVTIFEFKRPGRDDFVDLSSKEDPHEQIIRYVEDIREGKIKNFDDRQIQIGEYTPFYGYIVADVTPKVDKWLARKTFCPLPNGQKWFKWHTNFNLYLEFISWDQLVKDAEERNNTFFRYLGI